MKRLMSLLFLITLFFSCTTYQGGEERDFVFKDVNVISMASETIQYGQSVYISDGVIQSIGDFGSLDYPEGSTIVDCTDLFLTPGFSDMHVHTYSKEDLLLFLAKGVTKVRNMYGYPYHLRIRKSIYEKNVIGPELFTTSPIIDGNPPIWSDSYIISSTDQVEKSLTKLKEKGYDSFKIYERLREDVFIDILKVAEQLDMRVVGHVPENVDIHIALENGMTSIEHLDGYEYGEKDIDELSDTIRLTIDSCIWNCPTLVILDIEEKLFDRKSYPEIFSQEHNDTLKYVSPRTLRGWENAHGLDSHFDKSQELLGEIHSRGGNIISGTDQLNPYVIPGFSLHEEFRLLHECGLTPYEVLMTTTVNPARMLGISHRAGTIEVGKDADLVLLSENPLIDIDNTRAISGVMAKGVWFSENEISNMLDYVENKYR